MHRRHKRTRWEIIVVNIGMIFLAAAVTIAVYAAPHQGGRIPTIEAMQPKPEQVTACTAERPTVSPSPTAAEIITGESIIASRDWDGEDSMILLKIAMAEAEGESTEGKALVMLVILNRVWSDGFPDSIEDVVFQEIGGVYQFSPIAPGGRYWTTEPDEDCYKALEMVMLGWDESRGALYFEACAGESWQSRNCEFLFREGNHNFYK